MISGYIYELSGTPKLYAIYTSLYQEMRVMLRSETKIGRVYVLLEISLLSHYQESPREVHL